MRTLTQKVVKPHLPRTDNLTREERRRIKRNEGKQEKVYTLTQSQIDLMKKEISMAATKNAFLMMMGFPLLTLRDKFGFGTQRLNRFMDNMADLYEAYEKDYVSLDDLNDTIMEETGITLLAKRKGKY